MMGIHWNYLKHCRLIKRLFQEGRKMMFTIICDKCGSKDVTVIQTIYNEVVVKCENKECDNREVIAHT